MAAPFQASLLDALSPAGPGELGATVRRIELGDGAWVDVRPGWLGGADEVFTALHAEVPWRAERRQMYERVVEVPRLLAFYDEGMPLPHPALVQAKATLDAHYADELGEPFVTAGLCLYRDGHDSVAWHGDRIGRGAHVDTMVAIVSVGDPRPLLLRPAPSLQADSRATAHRFELGHGDLIVMGGSCQRTWEHSIPKTARPCGPRISIQFRTRGVR